MCDCTLKIFTESGGESSLFRSSGVFEKTNAGERVRYQIEGDEGELLLSDTLFEMRRFGKCGLKATFIEGERTEMLLGDTTLHGSIPINTTRYHLQQEHSKREIELCYELFAAEQIQKFSLKIQLFFSEEK